MIKLALAYLAFVWICLRWPILESNVPCESQSVSSPIPLVALIVTPPDPRPRVGSDPAIPSNAPIQPKYDGLWARTTVAESDRNMATGRIHCIFRKWRPSTDDEYG